jgi:hypothetical protein
MASWLICFFVFFNIRKTKFLTDMVFITFSSIQEKWPVFCWVCFIEHWGDIVLTEASEKYNSV